MKSKKKTNPSRRDFLKNSVLSVGAIGAFGPVGMSMNSELSLKQPPKNNHLNIAGYPVNRVKGIATGAVEIDGFTHKFKNDSIGDINTNLFSGPQDYDIAEIGLHPFMLAYANEGFRDYSLLPIFPLRVFRHKSVFVRSDMGINSPEDIRGKRIGTPGYSSTSLTWLRGIFQDEYGISPKDVTWVISRKDSSADSAGKVSKQESVLPDDLKIEYGTVGLDESELLVAGEVDVLFHAAMPKAFVEGNSLVKRLFPDSRQTEQEYYANTGIFPIMHAVAIRNSLIKENPSVVKSVFDAYSKAKDLDFQFMNKKGWAFDSLPWYAQEFEATKEVMGEDYWPYGIEKNRTALEALFRYSYEQGLSSQHLKIEDLFAEDSLNF